VYERKEIIRQNGLQFLLRRIKLKLNFVLLRTDQSSKGWSRIIEICNRTPNILYAIYFTGDHLVACNPRLFLCTQQVQKIHKVQKIYKLSSHFCTFNKRHWQTGRISVCHCASTLSVQPPRIQDHQHRNEFGCGLPPWQTRDKYSSVTLSHKFFSYY
jgi:hypothetical protein